MFIGVLLSSVQNRKYLILVNIYYNVYKQAVYILIISNPQNKNYLNKIIREMQILLDILWYASNWRSKVFFVQDLPGFVQDLPGVTYSLKFWEALHDPILSAHFLFYASLF